MKQILSFTITLIGICFFTINTYAVENEEITVETAIEIALRENSTLKIIEEKIKIAQAQLDGIPLFSNPELESEIIGGDQGEQTLELTKSFELGGKRRHRKQIAKIHLEKANLEYTFQSQKLIKSVKIAFYQIVLVQEKLNLSKELIKHNQQLYDMAQIQFETGDISVTQVGLASIQLQSARREFATLESDLRLAQLELNSLMGTPLDAKPAAVGKLSEKITTYFVLETLKKQALTQRPDLKSLRLNLQLTDSTYRLAKAANIPDLNIGGIAERSAGEIGFGLKLSIPLLIFDQNRSEIQATQAQKKVDTLSITDTERQIAREIVGAYLSINAAQKTLEFYEGDLLKLLNDNLTLTRSAYEYGEAELLEVILMQNELVKTRFNYLDALSGYQKALIELEAALGTSIDLVK